jgi:flagellar biosynthesis regulator FlbT
MSGRSKESSPELKKRLATLTEELTALHRDLYWLAQDSNLDAQNQDLADLNFDQVMSVKLAVDNVRELLWKYVDAVSRVEPERVHEALDANRMRRVTQLLELLRERLGRFPDQPPLSFIERVSAAIKEKLSGHGDKAA